MLLVPVTVFLFLLLSCEEVPLTTGLIAAGIAVVGLAVGLIAFRPDVGIGGLAAMALAIALGAVGGVARRRDALSRRALEAAREGMGDARAAVATLRAPAVPAASAPVDPSARIADLIATHRALGAEVATTVTGTPRVIDGACAGAITRAVQEGLSNARRHAPGATAQRGLAWTGSAVRLRVATALPEGRSAAAPAGRAAALSSDYPAGRSSDRSTGPRSTPSPDRGGLGLVGMKERFAALPRGGTASAGPVDGEFVITAEARL